MRFIDVNKVLQRARRFVSGTDNLSDEDVKEPRKLAEILRSTLRRLASVEAQTPPEATEFEVNCEYEGQNFSLAHNYNSPVRYYVTHWAAQNTGNLAPAGYGRARQGVIDRACSIGTWQNTAVNFTNGCRYTILRRRDVVGIRFAWVWDGANKNIRCVLWNDTTGAVLAEKTITVDSTGVWEAIFDTPYTADLTGVSIVCSYYELTGGQQTTSTDGVWKALVPVHVDEDHQLTAGGLVAAGNARPTIVHGGATTSLAEPIFGHERTGPELAVQPTSDANTLVLKSWVRGKAVVRVEPAQNQVTTP